MMNIPKRNHRDTASGKLGGHIWGSEIFYSTVGQRKLEGLLTASETKFDPQQPEESELAFVSKERWATEEDVSIYVVVLLP